MSKSTFKILFYLRKNYLNKEGKAGIMIRLSLNGEISQFSSKLDIEPDKWDTTLGKAKGNTQKARQLNETLEDIRASLKNHYRDIEVYESFVTVEKIRNAFLGITAKQRTLLELFKKHNEDARKLVGISKTPATLAKYDRCYRRLEEFMKVKYNISDISLKEIGHMFITDFENYLRTESKCNENTTAKFMQTFKMKGFTLFILPLSALPMEIDSQPYPIGYKQKDQYHFHTHIKSSLCCLYSSLISSLCCSRCFIRTVSM